MRRFLLAALVGTLVLSATAPAMARHAPASAKSAKASVTAAQPAKQAPDLRVGLASGRASVTITPAGGKATAQTESSKTITLAANDAAAIRWQAGAFLVGREKLRGEVLTIRPSGAGELALDGRRYRGALELRHKGGGLTAVNIVPVDDYLLSVVPEEMPVDWPAEAIKAQSVAARSFALASRGRHASEGYDLCTTTHCQLYTGTAAEKSASNAAIKATRGEVLMYGGKPIEALFHTDSGGMTENSEDVWGSHVPYLRAAKDTPAKTMPWTKTISRADLERKLAAKGHDIGKIRSIALSPLAIGRSAKDRTASGRVKTMTVKGTKGTVTLSGTTWRSLLGLKSTLFDAKLAKDMVTFTGYGSGHGLGISQWGAERMAAKGKSYADILHHYYTGTTLQQLY
ncbi:SpoIID/LytB domain-containing protein [Mitsuokella multacida]|uniref:SpoIID/LytB domain protein n=1 Tax=Mitsuokella multacida DSM 20544 TaxID=500635 RepID=C9KK55_9FIRM|nr:SpoIID/LytB domain-containing protein [Mitsuokella multacida]EEX69505.1 SpoIID/LytB domain protein [Mitsuokella multacida DSM 20544]